MSTRTLFNTVAEHLLAQREKSRAEIDGTSVCLYRGPRGLKCAVGCLIKDQDFREVMNSSEVADSDVIEALEASLGYDLSRREVNLLAELQYVHDSEEVTNWPLNLIRVAQAYDLELPPCLLNPPSTSEIP